MIKIFILFMNELYKISKKLSIYIMLIIMIAGMFVTAGIFKQVLASQASLQSQSGSKIRRILPKPSSIEI